MKQVPVENTKVTLSALAAMAKEGVMILTSKGQPLAAVKDLSGSDWESVALTCAHQQHPHP